MPKGEPLEFRFWSKVEKADGAPNGDHWIWIGYVNPNGYGQFAGEDPKKPEPAHRWAWALTGRDLIKGTVIANICGRRDCVRPSHHERITHRERRLRVIASQHRKGKVKP